MRSVRSSVFGLWLASAPSAAAAFAILALLAGCAKARSGQIFLDTQPLPGAEIFVASGDRMEAILKSATADAPRLLALGRPKGAPTSADLALRLAELTKTNDLTSREAVEAHVRHEKAKEKLRAKEPPVKLRFESDADHQRSVQMWRTATLIDESEAAFKRAVAVQDEIKNCNAEIAKMKDELRAAQIGAVREKLGQPSGRSDGNGRFAFKIRDGDHLLIVSGSSGVWLVREIGEGGEIKLKSREQLQTP